jgi:hypothetical protein
MSFMTQNHIMYSMDKIKIDQNVVHVFFQSLIDDAKFWDVEDNLNEFD